MGPARLKEYGLTSKEQLFDPLTNARVAYRLSDGGTNWQPWTTYTRGTYRQHLGENPTIQLAAGSGEAELHTDSTTTATGYDKIDSGQSLTAAATQPQPDLLVHELRVALGYEPVGTVTTPAAATAPLRHFLDAAVAQRGDPYRFGAKGASDDPNPMAFDCSGLTKWAAHQAGFELADGAAHQYLQLKAQGMLIPVDQAIHTPGALLFHFAVEPQDGSEPADAHVAISLGNGKTIEAANPQDGVGEFDSGGARFNYAAVIPGISDQAAQDASRSASEWAAATTHPDTSDASGWSDARLLEELNTALGHSGTSGHTAVTGSGLGLTAGGESTLHGGAVEHDPGHDTGHALGH
jgi:cell wall-associated NlpC family hydrolase